MRQFRDRNWPAFQLRRIENCEIAPLIRSPINCGQQITVALWRSGLARNKDRLGHEIPLGQLIGRPLIGLEIDMRQHVEGIERLAVAARREVAVAIVETGEAFVEPRKLAGEIVDLLTLEAVGI